MTEPEAARAAALAQARDRIAAETADKAARERARARRGRLMKVVVVGMFVVMAFERAVNSGWFHI